MRRRRLVNKIVALVRNRPMLPYGIQVGMNVHLGRDVKLDWSHGHHIIIEDDVTMVSGSRILCHDAASVRRTGLGWVAPVTVKRGAFVGANALLMPGVTVGEDAVVGAGAVVVKDVAPGTVVAGVPAHPIETVDQLDLKRLRKADTCPVFDARVYNQHPLSDEVLKELRDACRLYGGYYLRDRIETS